MAKREMKAIDIQMKALGAERAIEHEKDQFSRTGNAAFAWRAYWLARKFEVSLPAWVLGYLDGVAEALRPLDATQSPKAIAKALGLHTRGGGGSANLRAAQQDHDRAIRDTVDFFSDWKADSAQRLKAPRKPALTPEQRKRADRRLVVDKERALLDPVQMTAEIYGIDIATLRDRLSGRKRTRRKKPGQLAK